MKITTISAILISTFLLCGCGTAFNPKQVNLDLQMKYAENKEYLESIIDDKDETPTSELYYLCNAYSNLKDYNKLFPCVESLQHRMDIGDVFVVPTYDVSPYPSLLSAKTSLELGQYEKAIAEAEKAYSYISKRSLKAHTEMDVLATCGLIFSLAGEKQRARQLADELERYYSFVLALGMQVYKDEGLAKLYFSLGEYEKALEKSSKLHMNPLSTVVFATAGGSGLMLSAEIPLQFIQSKSLLEIGEISKAKEGYDELLKINQMESVGALYWQILSDRGRISLLENKPEEAIAFFQKSIDKIEQQRSTINSEANKIGFVGDKLDVYFYMIDALTQMGDYERAFEYIERSKARALVDMLASKKDFKQGASDSKKITEILNELDDAEHGSIAMAYSGTTKDQNQVRHLEEQKSTITNNHPELASLVSVNPLSVKSIQELLSADETLLEYYNHKNNYFAFVVTKDSVKGFKLDGSEINNQVEAFRNQVVETVGSSRGIAKKAKKPSQVAAKSTRFAELSKTCNQIYAKILQPTESQITTKNLTVVPHGPLHYIPFNALISDDEYLIDKYELRVLPSASVMKFLRSKRTGRVGELIVFGNPDLGDPKYDLPYAEAEAVALKKIQPNSKVLLRKQATETAVKKFGKEFKYVHFASHGTFNADQPLESGLMLSMDSQNDGKLSVGELYNLELDADLVTLSACETALGEIANGDDVVGFTRGFLYAGTNSIVSSLWQVDDQATSILMKEFYKNLRDKDKRAALRLAQLKVKDTYNSHPFFWAAFQLTGAAQ